MNEDTPFTSAPDEFVLGETAGEHRLERGADTADAALALVRQARHRLRIFSRDLDPSLLAGADFAAAAGEFARRSRFTTIRILVQDPTPAIRRSHALIELIQRLSSHVEARRVAEEWTNEPFAFIVADQDGLLYRPAGDRFEGFVDFAAGARALEQVNWFDRVWEQSTPEPEFRRLSI